MSQPNYSVYMIRTRENKLYTGVSNDVGRRFKEHVANGAKTAKALRGKGPLELVFVSVIGSRDDALRVEAQIKKKSKSEKEQMIEQAKTLA